MEKPKYQYPWAAEEEIQEMQFLQDAPDKGNGIAVGIHPYTHKCMYDTSKKSVLFVGDASFRMAALRKMARRWKGSAFFFDSDGNLLEKIAQEREKAQAQRVLKFQPTCKDGSSARWNPLAEVKIKEPMGWTQILWIANAMAEPNAEADVQKLDPFHGNTEVLQILEGVILHLLYKNDKAGLPCPTLADVAAFVSAPDLRERIKEMAETPLIDPKDFLEEPMEGVRNQCGHPMYRKNPFSEIYGEYIDDFTPYEALLGCHVNSIRELKEAIIKREENGNPVDLSQAPWNRLLVHPKIRQCSFWAYLMPILWETNYKVLLQAVAPYTQPIVQKNMEASDFSLEELLQCDSQMTVYLVADPKDKVANTVARLFVEMLLFSGNGKNPTDGKNILMALNGIEKMQTITNLTSAQWFLPDYGIGKLCLMCENLKDVYQRPEYAWNLIKAAGVKVFKVSCNSMGDGDPAPLLYRVLEEDTPSLKEIGPSKMALYNIPDGKVIISQKGEKPVYAWSLSAFQGDPFEQE